VAPVAQVVVVAPVDIEQALLLPALDHTQLPLAPAVHQECIYKAQKQVEMVAILYFLRLPQTAVVVAHLIKVPAATEDLVVVQATMLLEDQETHHLQALLRAIMADREVRLIFMEVVVVVVHQPRAHKAKQHQIHQEEREEMEQHLLYLDPL
jgi:hypothetical protein